jgi:hypothetical protein
VAIVIQIGVVVPVVAIGSDVPPKPGDGVNLSPDAIRHAIERAEVFGDWVRRRRDAAREAVIDTFDLRGPKLVPGTAALTDDVAAALAAMQAHQNGVYSHVPNGAVIVPPQWLRDP